MFSLDLGGRYREGAVFLLRQRGTTFFGRQPGCFRDSCRTVYAFCQQENCPDGALPRSGLIDVKGILYGTTGYDGRTRCPQTGDCGTVFSIDPNTGTETVLYAFCNQQYCLDGWAPEGNLIAVNGVLYGTTYLGGQPAACDPTPDCGTVFSIDANTGGERVLYSFATGKGVDGDSTRLWPNRRE